MVSYRPGERYPPHAHPQTTITLVVRGGLEERVGSRTHPAGPLSLVVKPAWTEHADAFGRDGASTLQVTLAAGDTAWLDPEDRGLGTWRWTYAPSVARVMLGLLRALRADPAAPGGVIEDKLCELFAALRPVTDAGRCAVPRWLAEVEAQLERTDASIRSIAGLVGVHPVHLAQAFRRHRGTSPSAHRRSVRLRRAAAMIADTPRALVDIAFECGFADQAHMTRVMRGALGETPGGLRRLSVAS